MVCVRKVEYAAEDSPEAMVRVVSARHQFNKNIQERRISFSRGAIQILNKKTMTKLPLLKADDDKKRPQLSEKPNHIEIIF